ncbi:MAG TPA: DUF5666 domain-containing protein [Methylomirabilota bacterium]|nr:DUF5666 domain-containing protein [Methylomirabilota bacterium]
MLHVRGLLLGKDFNIGSSCAFVLWDNPAGAMSDLRAGEKVKVSYQNANGVLVADRIEQKMMREEGTVKAIEQAAHTMTLHSRGMDKTLQIADDCKVILRNDHSGQLPDVQPGNFVTVTYETPDNKLTALQIAQTSAKFSGTLTAIDLQDKTLKAKSTFGTKTFKVGDNCEIVLNGNMGGQLSDLKPNDKLVFNYDEVNGVNIVNRIATAPEPKPETTSVQPGMYP